ncbi:MAG: hypothetical protein AAB403_05170 [Planctomycetota bacterium]
MLILDELGKFLEFAAGSPEQQDVYFLQQLGESAARSGDVPIVVLGLLHQGFAAYADRLTDSAQREWQKVAGRFEELLFDRPILETANLVADALGVESSSLPNAVRREARQAMTGAAGLGWYGQRPGDLTAVAERLYPLHSTVLPALVKLISRFGQNERSLFSFLLSSERHGLQEFARRAVGPSEFYRIHDLYDYARITLAHHLRVQSYRSHWNLLESIVESFPSEHELEINVLKTVAILNLLDDQGLLPTEAALTLSVESNAYDKGAVSEAIARLQDKRVLYRRGTAGGYCLWPHTSVNIERAYGEAQKAIAQVGEASSVVSREVDTRPLVARRHYIETGNLRHFEVRCVSAAQFDEHVDRLTQTDADGVIIVPLCENEPERLRALAFAQSKQLRDRPNVLVAISRPLEMLRSMALEAERWRWVAENTPELAQDRYAAEEVSRQIEASREILRNRIQDLVGLRNLTEQSDLKWYRNGREARIPSSRDLLSLLSDTCDRFYHSAPKIRNELLNRRQLSSAAAAARMRLIERVLTTSSEPLLGLDGSKAPPEMSMYLSVLRRGNLHVESGGVYALVKPKAKYDELGVLPIFTRLTALLRAEPDARVKVSTLRDSLGQAPYGVRDGVFVLLLAIYVAIYESEIAAYEDGHFVPKLDGGAFMRMVKEPASFELQFCRISGVRASVFAKLARALKLQSSDHVVDVVRALVTFASRLPQCTHQSRRLSREALSVRSALASAKEPAMLLFQQLPVACGSEPFRADAAAGERIVVDFVTTLKASLDELRQHYNYVLDGVRTQLLSSFEESDTPGHLRPRLTMAAAALLPNVHEQKLRGFCLRLNDQVLGDVEWLEAIAAFVMGKRPAEWSDADSDRFPQELQRFAQLFRRVEATAFERSATSSVFAARLSVTLHDGSDVARVVHLSAEDEPLARQLESQIQDVFKRSRLAGLAATSRVLMRELSDAGVPEKKSEH